jgi:hypothetical protein
MHVRKRKTKARVKGVENGSAAWWDLILGVDERKPAFSTERARRKAWVASRAEIMASTFGHRPGKRPDAYWDYDIDWDAVPEGVMRTTTQAEAIYLLPEIQLPGEADYIRQQWQRDIASALALHPGDAEGARESAVNKYGVPEWFLDEEFANGTRRASTAPKREPENPSDN